MVCILFGHRDAPDTVKTLLKKIIIDLLQRNVRLQFLVGNNGSFDAIVQRVFKELRQEYPTLDFSVALSYIGEQALCGDNSVTIFPDGQERALRRFAINKRNDWMLNKADIVICYVRHNFSNSSKLLDKARKKGATIINLA